MGLFGNIGSMAATAINRIKVNQQTQPSAIGGVFGAARAANAAAAAGGNQGIVPGSPGGMLGSIMRGRNVANQNQLSSTAINPSAFNTGTVSQLFNSNTTNGYVDPVLSGTPGVGTPIVQKKSSPLKQTMDGSVDPLTGQYIDPTMSQGLDPGTVDPMLDQDATSLTQY